MNSRSQVLDLEDDIRAELGRPRTLADAVVNAAGFAKFVAGSRTTQVGASAPVATLLTPELYPARPGVVRQAGRPSTPLLDAIAIVDDVSDGVVDPVTVAFMNAADEHTEGADETKPESTLTYTHGERTKLPTIAHAIPVTTQALRNQRALRADIDGWLAAGLVTKMEARVAATLAAASGTVAHPFDTDVATTIRTGIAAAQRAMPELGPGTITVALSPEDHAEVDLGDVDLAAWPARIISTPALAPGTAYIGRLGLAVVFYASSVTVALSAGWVDKQFIQNRVTVLGELDGLAHVAAPAAIVKADLTADDQS